MDYMIFFLSDYFAMFYLVFVYKVGDFKAESRRQKGTRQNVKFTYLLIYSFT